MALKNNATELLFDISPGLELRGSEYIYHYTSWRVARDYILGGNRSIRFGSVSHMNDPLEFQKIQPPSIYGAWSETVIPRISNQIRKANREGVRMFCTTKDIPSRRVGLSDYPQTMPIRGFTHAPMWHHYADSHEGVCLILSKSILSQAINGSLGSQGKLMSGDVQYSVSDNFIDGTGNIFKPETDMENWSDQKLAQYVKKQMDKRRTEFYFTKHSSWQYEQEYRWVFSGNGSPTNDVSIGNAVVGLVVGSDFDSVKHAQVKDVVSQLEIPVRRIWWSNGAAAPLWDLEAFEGEYDPGTELESEAKKRRARRRESLIRRAEEIQLENSAEKSI